MAASKFTDVREFLLNTPLYSGVLATKDDVQELTLLVFGLTFDGHCPQCHREATFALRQLQGWHHITDDLKNGTLARRALYADCARNKKHVLMFLVEMEDWTIRKIGQFPSLADIAIDESKTYSNVLDNVDGRELHTAIGLAAHGVGIGSFVYLRRIFERLIWRRFREFQASEGWDEAKFASLGMDEKVKSLQGHLPNFLVENRSIYSILSVGLHELSETDCLADFSILKHSIILILEEDQRKKAALARQEEFTKAIQNRTSALAAKNKKP